MTMRRRGGSTPYVRLDLAVKADQGSEAHQLHTAGFTFAEVADRMGVSLTTAWRRCRWFEDWTTPAESGHPIRRIPPQRGTRACPRGRPCIPEVDHPELQNRAPRRCHATCRDGRGCGNPPMRGQAVCRMHGGASPQARRAAARGVVATRQRQAIGYRLHQYC
jgi:hypothetical protein